VFDFFYFLFFHFKIWVITSKEGKRGGKKNSKRQLTLNREKKKKKRSVTLLFLLWEVSETKEVLYLFALVY